ncbi:hypothetical protein HBA55_25950 [Pseudomaricurvus alkylphenolicus]|jgi:hypothetical protein|uniref:hypothetical protein n=1 Tax=Pseudomaricurvus alkylphenolicus TaxID=1306991 RepID=UPI0014244B86|nr:hypothetical protein [Pseudomaricurvus alkylphenolicus]NIB43079.1 hypothetical protein [Pseudomaricurvus alkylphenolicus]
MLIRYLGQLPLAKQILWCYLIWYLCIAALYLDTSASLWLNSLGISLLVGYALFLSTGPGTLQRIKQQFWQSLRLFLCPFLVSSFSSLVKGKGFFLLFSPHLFDNLTGFAACLTFLITVQGATLLHRNKAPAS